MACWATAGFSPPDYPVKVFNLESGYGRDNKNWIVGRILRDVETNMHVQRPPTDGHFRIHVFRAVETSVGPTQFQYTKLHLFGLLLILAQLALSAIPIILGGEWDILLITSAATLLAQITGMLPQWTAEKLPYQQRRSGIYALTQGNGSREVVVIDGQGVCLNLEEMAAPLNPRSSRPWEKFGSWILSRPRRPVLGPKALGKIQRRGTFFRNSRDMLGLPVGFCITMIVCLFQSLLWLLLLINVATPRNYNWVLLGVGAIGMFQNGFLAAMSRPSQTRNLPLRWVETIDP